MAKKIRTCKICGKQYEYCGHCPTKNVIEPWRNLYCSENCREAFKVMGDYSVKKISAIEAKDALVGLGISSENVRDKHKTIVNEIFNVPTLTFKEEIKVSDPVVEEISTVEEVSVSEEVSDVEDVSAIKEVSSTEEKPAFHKNFKKKKRPNIVNDN